MSVARPVSVDKEAFERDGYLVFDPQIHERDLDRVVEETLRHFQPRSTLSRLAFWRDDKPEDPLPTRFTDMWAVSPTVRGIATAPAILEVLRQLYGREPKPFQTLNFPVGTQQKTHSDAVHFNTEPRGFMCAVWVALEDIDMDNGPLVYYPGSQKRSELMPSDVGIEIQPGQTEVPHDEYMAAYEPYVENLIQSEGLEPHYGTMRKGEALLWSTNLLHGGMPVRDPKRTRHSQVTHYRFEGTRLWTPLLSTPEHVSWRDAPEI